MLQLFMQLMYESSNLDLYIHKEHTGDLIIALESGLGCIKMPTCKTSGLASHKLYLKCRVHDVDDFVLPKGRVIQVISTHSALVQTILRYHSTAVMNFTLEDFAFLYTRLGDNHGLVQCKYEQRGWLTVEDSITVSAHNLEEDQVIPMEPDTVPIAHALIMNKTDKAEHSSDIGTSCLTFPPMSQVISDEQTWIIRLKPAPYPPLLLMDLVPPLQIALDCHELALC
ncbi:hypothetical protein BDN71DRAFT_1525426 [Pleurotus eryngii]|uniref:Uncharacterized protein n=1 Tax=Pleurotus eryngii TaxID=5323 RepID=A0A9P5ZKK4_PLEER|nr:hypothetical protein BDN71DRAFT_1525426 [Pleurotus eryngii]